MPSVAQNGLEWLRNSDYPFMKYGAVAYYYSFVARLINQWKKYLTRGLDILRLPSGVLEYTELDHLELTEI